MRDLMTRITAALEAAVTALEGEGLTANEQRDVLADLQMRLAEPHPDLDQELPAPLGRYDAGFRDAVESFIVAGVDAGTVLTVLDAFGNNAPDDDQPASSPQDRIRVVLGQGREALALALPHHGTHEPDAGARWTAHQRAGKAARDAIASLDAQAAGILAMPAAEPDMRARTPVRTAFPPTLGAKRYVRLVSDDGLILAQCEDGVYAAGDGEQNARWLAACANQTRHLPLALIESPDYALALVQRPTACPTQTAFELSARH